MSPRLSEGKFIRRFSVEQNFGEEIPLLEPIVELDPVRRTCGPGIDEKPARIRAHKPVVLPRSVAERKARGFRRYQRRGQFLVPLSLVEVEQNIRFKGEIVKGRLRGNFQGQRLPVALEKCCPVPVSGPTLFQKPDGNRRRAVRSFLLEQSAFPLSGICKPEFRRALIVHRYL